MRFVFVWLLLCGFVLGYDPPPDRPIRRPLRSRFVSLLVENKDPKVPTSAVPCDLVNCHDGDTFTVILHLPFGVDLPDRHVRAYGYDCWEVNRVRSSKATEDKPITDSEITKGLKARDEFLDLIKQGRLYLEDSGEHDPYGRVSAVPWIQIDNKWIYVPAWMEENGHCRVPRNK